MSTIEWIAQGLLLLLLLAALPIVLRLERGLAALRRDRATLAETAGGFEAAAREAGATLSGLRAALEAGARQAATGEALRDDLRFLLDRAERMADRLDGLVRQARGLAPAHPPASPASFAPAFETALESAPGSAVAPRSQAERDLLQVLRMAR